MPLGAPAPGALARTVAVNDTGWPGDAGLTEDEKTVVVASFVTTWVKNGEPLAAKLTSPL